MNDCCGAGHSTFIWDVPAQHTRPSYTQESDRVPQLAEKLEPRPTLESSGLREATEHKSYRELFAHLSLDTWFWEISSALASAACVTSLIVILAIVNNSELRSWSVFITPNAIVSIGSTAAKASMIFALGEAISQLKWLHLKSTHHTLKDLQVYDDASRGPLGATAFLWQFLKPPLVTCVAFVGCIVVVFSIAFDPFTQQILSYPNRPTLVSRSNATISQTAVYDPEALELYGTSYGGYKIPARQRSISASIVDAILNGPSIPRFSCPTANCTFPDFPTLGVSSICRNVTKESRRKCRHGLDALDSETQFCEFTLPGNVSLEAATGETSLTLFNATVDLPEGIQAKFVNMSMLQWPFDFANSPGRSQLLPWSAWQCELSIVAYVFSGVNVINGTIHLPDPKMSHLTSIDHGALPQLANMMFFKATKESFPSTDAYLYPDCSGSKSLYLANVDELWYLGHVFEQLFDYSYFMDNTGTASYGIVEYPLATASNMSQVFGAIATSMTHTFMASANATEVPGSAYDIQTYISVKWVWLSLPIALVSTTWLFLAAVVLLTSKQQQSTWKSTIYPLLTDSVRGNYPSNRVCASESASHMEALAKQSTSALHSRAETTADHATDSVLPSQKD